MCSTGATSATPLSVLTVHATMDRVQFGSQNSQVCARVRARARACVHVCVHVCVTVCLPIGPHSSDCDPLSAGNTMVRSDGIALLDQQHFGSHGVNQNDCPAYEGAYIRWSVIRRNNLSGISRAQQPENRCASITNSNPNSTDVLSEHNVIDCPEGGVTVNANGAKLPWTDINCSHCVTRR